VIECIELYGNFRFVFMARFRSDLLFSHVQTKALTGHLLHGENQAAVQRAWSDDTTHRTESRAWTEIVGFRYLQRRSNNFFGFAHCKCNSLLFRSSRLSVVCLSVRIRSRKLSETGAKFRRPYRKSGSPSKNMTSHFAPK